MIDFKFRLYRYLCGDLLRILPTHFIINVHFHCCSHGCRRKNKNRNVIDIEPTERNRVNYISEIHRYLFQTAVCLYRFIKGSIWKKRRNDHATFAFVTTNFHFHSLDSIVCVFFSHHSLTEWIVIIRSEGTSKKVINKKKYEKNIAFVIECDHNLFTCKEKKKR